MIEDTIIKDKVVAITSYCDNQTKLNVLIENIKLIRLKFPNLRIALHANYPLSEEVQKMVDHYFYEDLNYTDDDKWIWYWNIIMDSKQSFTYFNKKFLYTFLDSGFSVFQQIKALTKYLIDYKWVMLINYDTCVEEIRIEDNFMEKYDLTVHHFPDQKAYSLIMMSFRPQIFFDKVVKKFTFENWHDPKRKDQLNEGRLHDIINESDIKHFVHHYLVYDKIKNEPDYHQGPNVQSNDYFQKYLLYFINNILEIYIWDFLKEIKNITLEVDNNVLVVKNQNQHSDVAFQNILEYKSEKITDIKIIKINDIDVDIPLKLKKGYYTTNI